jgi:cell division septum initiation protein DivIVA
LQEDKKRLVKKIEEMEDELEKTAQLNNWTQDAQNESDQKLERLRSNA